MKTISKKFREISVIFKIINFTLFRGVSDHFRGN